MRASRGSAPRGAATRPLLHQYPGASNPDRALARDLHRCSLRHVGQRTSYRPCCAPVCPARPRARDAPSWGCQMLDIGTEAAQQLEQRVLFAAADMMVVGCRFMDLETFAVEARAADAVVVVAVQGGLAQSGVLQAFFEMHGVPVTGALRAVPSSCLLTFGLSDRPHATPQCCFSGKVLSFCWHYPTCSSVTYCLTPTEPNPVASG